MTIVEYVTEEVNRQGHDTTTVDGLSRVSMMLDGWRYALQRQTMRPILNDVVALGKRVERQLNQFGMRQCGVRVGSRICPPPNQLQEMLHELFQRRDDLKPLEFYREFEEIHPFKDGNGRTGKILLNWLNGTLAAPIFPPKDFWGHEIRNP